MSSKRNAPVPTDDQIRAAFAGTNFGPGDIVVMAKNGVLKEMCGYWNGHTMTTCLISLGLVRKVRHNQEETEITELGRSAAYVWFKLNEDANAPEDPSLRHQ